MLSKHAWVVSFKAKSGNDVATAIVKIFWDDGRCPKNLQTDKGKEFYNANMQKLLKKHDINHYSTYSVIRNEGISDQMMNINHMKNDM